jgi:hypothetical protein
MDMPEHKWFYFKHGRRASNIEELKTALESIDESEFKHHVNDDRNDFANWVENVFGEEKLAGRMREVGSKEGIIIMLDDFLSQDNEPPSPPLIIPKEHPKRHHKRVIIPEENRLNLEPEKEFSFSENELSGKELPEKEPSEKELSEKEIKDLVNEAMLVFDRSETGKAEEEEKKDELEIGEKEGAEETGETEESEETDAAEEEWAPKHKPRLEIEKPALEKEPLKKEHHKFMVEEFLYGFIMGLIFGLIMLGVILQLKVT